MITIQKATASDLPYITQSIQKLFAYHASIDQVYRDIREEELVDQYTDLDLCFVAVEGSTQCGSIVGQLVEKSVDRISPYTAIQHIWVEEAFRGNGIAKKLVTAFEEAAQQHGAQYIDLHVDVRNMPGKQLWDNLGYTVYQERRKKMFLE